jgi:hypothetical protein
MKSAVAYIRTSKRKQSLGLEAQQAALDLFAQSNGYRMIQTFQEQESGKGHEPPNGSRWWIALEQQHSSSCSFSLLAATPLSSCGAEAAAEG